MSIPGFTAEAALDQRSVSYQASAGRSRLAPNLIRPAQVAGPVSEAVWDLAEPGGGLAGWIGDRWCGLPTLTRVWTGRRFVYHCVRYCAQPIYYGNGKVVWHEYTRPC
jgi:hypothetical protein